MSCSLHSILAIVKTGGKSKNRAEMKLFSPVLRNTLVSPHPMPCISVGDVSCQSRSKMCSSFDTETNFNRVLQKAWTISATIDSTWGRTASFQLWQLRQRWKGERNVHDLPLWRTGVANKGVRETNFTLVRGLENGSIAYAQQNSFSQRP